MKRSDFLKLITLSPLALAAMQVKEFESISQSFPKSPRMPLLFIGHGHPMNAIFDNHFTQSLQKMTRDIPKPNAIMVISAHWETRGTYVSVNPQPKTIYDFGGFDNKLYQIKYEPQGHPALAREVLHELPFAKEDQTMGLDHGAWTILKFLYPQADIPVFQMSIDYTQPTAKHYEIAQALKKMRDKGVLIIGSGNIVHNLGKVDWHNINAKSSDWAIEFDSIVKNKLDLRDFKSLIDYKTLGTSAQLSIPSEDHYLPMLYTLGLAESKEPLHYLFEGFQFANISMRCFKIG